MTEDTPSNTSRRNFIKGVIAAGAAVSSASYLFRTTALLQSHTVETGAQEIAALVLASAVVATERARAAKGQVPVLRIRFGHVLHVVRGMWLFFGPFDDVFTARQKNRVIRRGYDLMRHSLTAERRSRSCPRAVRQTIKAWPRLLRPQSVEGPVQFTLVG